MQGAGISVDGAQATITDEQKQQLLAFLRDKHGSEVRSSPNKIVLKRKTTSELTAPSSTSKGAKVKVEVRKKRTYVKRTEADKETTADLELLNARRIAEEEKAKAE
jgi:translation initiation factor IF-2